MSFVSAARTYVVPRQTSEGSHFSDRRKKAEEKTKRNETKRRDHEQEEQEEAIERRQLFGDDGGGVIGLNDAPEYRYITIHKVGSGYLSLAEVYANQNFT